jgi:hypothetical protein
MDGGRAGGRTDGQADGRRAGGRLADGWWAGGLTDGRRWRPLEWHTAPQVLGVDVVRTELELPDARALPTNLVPTAVLRLLGRYAVRSGDLRFDATDQPDCNKQKFNSRTKHRITHLQRKESWG